MKKQYILLLIFIFLSGCAVTRPKPKPVIKKPVSVKIETPFKLLTGEKIPFFADKADKKDFLKAAEKNALYLESVKDNERFYMFGARKVNAKLLIASADKFLKTLKSSKNDDEFNLKIKENFDVYQMAGSDNKGTVTFSSYYEPVINAGLSKTKKYKYPIYAKPPDLIYADLENFNPKFKGEKISGKIENGKLIPYYTRHEIDFQNLFEGKNLEIAWFANRIDIMDLHIQGSGKLALPDGKKIKAKFAATNSLPFKGWITHLLKTGVLKRKDLTYQKAKQYVLDHPEIETETLSVNKRYTFFKLEEIGDPLEGPQGTFGYPLVGMRSIATDASILPLGALAYISFKIPKVDAKNKFIGLEPDSRFVFCQDTGGAIKGPGRVDFFAGTGYKAHVFANKLWGKGTLHLFVLKEEQGNKKSSSAANSKVLTGLDILEKQNFNILEGKKAAIITNHSAINSKGAHAIDILHKSPKVNLVAILSPEHGLRGKEEGGLLIKNSTDPATGLPIFSLYGKTKRPTAEMLKGIDILIFDIQDVGARFYTYLTTMGYAMEEAAKLGIEFVVLDRPNPIGGHIVEGPILQENIKAFTAYFPVPVRHGLTAGEMALLHKDDKNLDLKLSVVKMEGWKRNSWFDETKLSWLNPSPNLRELNAEILYPGVGCFEATNVSVGRGTKNPFLWFGAPWMKAEIIVEQLSKAGLPGLTFKYEEKTPEYNMYAGSLCKGISVQITDRKKARPLDMFVYSAYYLRKYNSEDFEVREKGIRRMIGYDKFLKLFNNKTKPEKIIADFEKNNSDYKKNREKYLLY